MWYRVTFLSILFALFPVSAFAITIDFEDLKSGEFVSTQYSSMGLTIEGINPYKSHDAAIAFDSQKTPTADPDLIGPSWSMGNITNETLGMMLIIAENVKDLNGDGYVDNPDDEANGGKIKFTFSTQITSLGFDLLDLESAQQNNFLQFYQGQTLVGTLHFGQFVNSSSAVYDSSIVYGDNSANHFDPIAAPLFGVNFFDTVVFNFATSAAIDNVKYTEVPEPGTLLLMGVGLFGGARRFSRKQSA